MGATGAHHGAASLRKPHTPMDAVSPEAMDLRQRVTRSDKASSNHRCGISGTVHEIKHGAALHQVQSYLEVACDGASPLSGDR